MSYTKANDLRKAEKLVQQGKIKPAIKEYENLVASNPGDTNLLNILGDLYVRDGRNDDAIITFVKLAEATLRDGHTPRAIAVYKKIYKLAPGNADVALKLAELYLRQNLIVEARKQYLELADYYTKNGRSQQALELLQRVADLDPENVPARLRLAENYQREGMTEKAIEAYIAAGSQLIRKSSLVEAQQVFQRVLELNPTSTPALNSLATIYIKQGDSGRAVALLDNVARQRPDDTDLLILSGRIYLQAELLDEAEKALLKLLKVDKTRFEYLLTLAQKFAEQGYFDRAVSLVEQCVEPMVTRRQETRGVELLKSILESEPYHVAAHQCRATLYKRLGESNELPEALKSLAQAAMHHNKRDIAEQALKELIELEPNEPAHLELMRAWGFTSTVSPTIAERDRLINAPVYAGGVGQRVEFVDIPTANPPLTPTTGPAGDFGFTSGSGFQPQMTMPYQPPGTPGLGFGGTTGGWTDFTSPHSGNFSPQAPGTGFEGGSNGTQSGSFGVQSSSSSIEAPSGSFGPFGAPPPLVGGYIPPTTEVLPEEARRLKADAERFANLGMPDQAIHLLHEAVQQAPHSIELRLLLKQLYTDIGQPQEAAQQATVLASLYAQQGDYAQSQRFQQEAQQAAGSIPAGGSFDLSSATVSSPPPSGGDEVEIDISGEVQAPAPAPFAASAPSSTSSPAGSDFGYTSGDGFVIPTDAIYSGPAHFPATQPPEEPFTVQVPTFDLRKDQSGEVSVPMTEEKLREQLEGVNFYIEQGFYDIARDNLTKLSLDFPNHPEILALLAKVQAPVQPKASEPTLKSLAVPTDAPAEVPVSKPESIGSLMNGLVSELEKALEELEMGHFDAPAVTNLSTKPEAATDKTPTGPLFLGESGLQDVFDEFKQSVEVDTEATPDFETHYNLGLAYKDMDLFDEAIEEFQTAFRGTDPNSPAPHYFQVCNMLGLCFMAKNEPQLATVWFKRGVEAPGRTEDEYQAMRYDLGLAYEQMGRYDQALEVFEMVYAVDINYREVAEKLAELRRRVKH
jgi:tetratricopeptide (TPR) repeat protein